MVTTIIRSVKTELIDDDQPLALAELCRYCHTPHETIKIWVLEGVLTPAGHAPEEWRFNHTMLRRARLAHQMAEDMEINAAGIALALDLLEQIDRLHAQIARQGV